MPPLRQSIVQSESRPANSVRTKLLLLLRTSVTNLLYMLEDCLECDDICFSFFLFVGGFLIISWPSCRSINLKLLEILSIVVHLDHPHVLRALGAYYCQTVLRKCFFIIECLTFHVTEYQATLQGNLSILYSILVSGILIYGMPKLAWIPSNVILSYIVNSIH